MRGGLITSVMLHAAILGWALFSIQSQRELRAPEPEPIAIDLVNASDLTKLRQGARNAKLLEAEPKEAPKTDPAKKEAPKPVPAATAPPPPPPPPPPPEPAKEEPKKEEPKKPDPPKEALAVPPPPAAPPPGPTPDEQKQLEEKLKEEQRKAEDQKRIEEERKAEEQKKIEEEQKREAEKKAAELKKKKEEDRKKKLAEQKKKREDDERKKAAEAKKNFDAERISALLNKIPDKGGARPSVPLDQQAKTKGPVLGAPEGQDKQLSASERAVLAQIIRSCVQAKWNLSAGGEEAMNTVIKLRLQFRPDGTLSSPPQIANPQNDAYFLAASEGAVRAAQACEPYSLPSEKYEAWRDVLLTFSLRDMLR